MKYVVLGGYGEMGRITVRDLFETTDDEIWIVGRDAAKARKYARSFNSRRVTWASLDVGNVSKLARFLKGKSVCINSTQYYFNIPVMRACLAARVPYLDLGGLFHTAKKQLKLHRKFQKAGLLALIGCGATPGITNVMAGYGASLLDRISDIHIKFGGKDYTEYAQPFVLPYSAQTIFDEFTMKAAVFANKRLKMIDPFSDTEAEYFSAPVGKRLAGSILHSELATFPKNFKTKGIAHCTFKASFDEDFTKFIQGLVHRGFATEPYRRRTVEFLNKFLPDPKTRIRDVEILRVTMTGTKNGRRKRLTIDCRATSNPSWNAPAGTVDTAVPPSIIAQMIAHGTITAVGVVPPELCIPPKPFFAELKKRGMSVTTRIMGMAPAKSPRG